MTIVLAMIPAALGFGGASGTAMGIWTIVALALALAAAGYVAGALAARGGLFHGFLTWATSTLGVLVLAGWLGTTALGALGGALGGVLGAAADQTSISQEQAQTAAQQTQQQIDQQDVDQAQQQAQQAAAQAADTAETGIWWTFAGSLIGAGVASLTGAAGARSVIIKRREYTTERANL